MKSKTLTCYRFVNEDMTSHQDKITKWELGVWNKIEGKAICCEYGFHASKTPLQSINNVYGDRWFITEAKGKFDKQNNKFCASEMRLIKEIPIMVVKRFALWCAKSCLKNYEKEYPNDKRVADCIKATEDYLDGKIELKELSAARSAGSAARSAARSAESAAESAARSAGSAAEKRQNKELLRLIKEYTI